MRRYSTTSAPDVGTTGGSKGACAAIALGSALLVGSTVGALAAEPPNPTANHAWGGCTLNSDAVTALVESITGDNGETTNGFFDTTEGSDLEVSFVMVYALENDNDGQPLASGGSTGVILCTNPAVVGVQTTTETTALPNVDILDGEQTFVLQYQLNGGSGDIEKRVCQHTDSNTDCFRVFPSP